MMRYINLSEHGGPEVMEIKEGHMPDPEKGEVLKKVANGQGLDVLLD